MAEFRKVLTSSEIDQGAIFWDHSDDQKMKKIIPQTLVFDVLYENQEYSNLVVEWEKRKLFIGEPVASAAPGSELILGTLKEHPASLVCHIFAPQDKMIIRKRLSHQEHNRRYLKWFAREDELYERLFASKEDFEVEIAGKKIAARSADFEKRKLAIGSPLRCFSPGDDLLIYWKSASVKPILVIVKEELVTSSGFDNSAPLRSLVTRLLSRPLDDFDEGEVKALIVLLEENKKLWERLVGFQEENRCLKEQVSMLESLFEQFSSNSFFRAKKDFETWVAGHMNLFEKGLRVIHRNYNVNLKNGRKRRIDILCQDRKGVLAAVQILFSPEPAQIDDALDLMMHLRANIEAFGSELTGGQLKSADIRGMIISNYEKTDLIEECLQRKVKLCLVKSGCLIDVLE